MTKAMKTNNKSWQAVCEKMLRPVFDRFHDLHGFLGWEGYATLNTDRPNKKDIIIQHWIVGKNVYILRILADGSGWDVFKPVSNTNTVDDTLSAIV